jgi:hypothetical protein
MNQAIRVYNINNDIASWRNGGRVIDLPADAVPFTVRDDGLKVAEWADVLLAAKVAA